MTRIRWSGAALAGAMVVALAAVPAAAQEPARAPVPALLEPDVLLAVGRLVESNHDPEEVLGSEKEGQIEDRSLTVFDHVYVPLVVGERPVEPGDRLRTFRLGERVVDPVTGAPAGRVLAPTGVVVVDSLAHEVAVARVEHAFAAIEVGDGVEAVTTADTTAPRTAPVVGAEGYVLAFQEPKELHPTYDVVFLRLASPAALTPGSVVDILHPGGRRDGRRLPDVRGGRAMVVRVRGDVAAAVLYGVRRSDLEVGLPFRSVDPGR